MELTSLIGKNLPEAFSVQRWTEVYDTDTEFIYTKSVGIFRTRTIAAGFAEGNVHYRTREVAILTNGDIGFLLQDVPPMKIIPDDVGIRDVRERALAKLTAFEQFVLKVDDQP